MPGSPHTSEAFHLASSKTTPVLHIMLWRTRPSPHPATPSITSATLSTLVESFDKKLEQGFKILARAQYDDPSAFSVAASSATLEASHFQICLVWGQLHQVCHAPDPGPTRLADPNRSPGRDTIYTIYWDSH